MIFVRPMGLKKKAGMKASALRLTNLPVATCLAKEAVLAAVVQAAVQGEREW